MIQERGSEAVTYEKLVLPFGSGIQLSHNYSTGHSVYDDGGAWSLKFTSLSRYQKKISVRHTGVIDAQLTYVLSDRQEGVNCYTPMNPDGSQFFYSRKQYGYQVFGTLTYKGKEYKIEKTPGGMDWGRGVWPYRSYWVWASAATYQENGHLFALNLGVFHAKHAAATDDFVTIVGRVLKLGVISCPECLLDTPVPGNWTFSTLNTQPAPGYAALHATFTPDSTYNKEVNLLLIHSQLKQVFGTFSGLVQYEGGELRFTQVRGFLERHVMRW